MARFNARLAAEKERYLQEETQKRIQQNKDRIIAGSIEQVVMETKINELKNAILEKQELQAEQRKQQKAEAKISEAEKMPVEERKELLNSLKNDWIKASNRHRKIKEIEQVLEKGIYKCKTSDGKILEGEEAKNEMEKFKEQLFERNGFLSDRIINNIDRLTGRNLRKEAIEKTGYNPEDPATAILQNEFRRWLTKEVQKIYRDQVKILKKHYSYKWIADAAKELLSEPKSGSVTIKKSMVKLVDEAPRVEKLHVKEGKELKKIRRIKTYSRNIRERKFGKGKHK